MTYLPELSADKPALEREWLHIHIFEGELCVFTDSGHWKNTPGRGGKEDWDNAILTTFDALDRECYVGSVDGFGTLMVRIPLSPKVLIGKFGMPYVDLS